MGLSGTLNIPSSEYPIAEPVEGTCTPLYELFMASRLP
jgi:hypothetical protein